MLKGSAEIDDIRELIHRLGLYSMMLDALPGGDKFVKMRSLVRKEECPDVE
jgi:hypothetical protein